MMTRNRIYRRHVTGRTDLNWETGLRFHRLLEQDSWSLKRQKDR
jgi:hypothetical protein